MGFPRPDGKGTGVRINVMRPCPSCGHKCPLRTLDANNVSICLACRYEKACTVECCGKKVKNSGEA